MHLDSGMDLRPTSARTAQFAPALYPAALFLSALLLFAIAPMFTKMVLPRIGGAAAVWSVAMVFFQAALLLGYAYAYLLSRMLSPGPSALVHLTLLAVAATTLPIGIAQGFEAAPQEGLELWLLALFAASIGLPFVALAANAPLLQNWFAVSGHPHAANPYVLYAASNLGSFVSLMTYPFVVEPLSTLHTQILAWSVGYLVLILLIAAAALSVARVDRPSFDTAGPATVAAPTIAERIMWTVFAAIPAGLVIAVTAAISTDLAAAPFLWVLPLSLYLLTFVAIFRDRAWVAHGRVLSLVPFAAVALIAATSFLIRPYLGARLAVHLVGFVVLALACHGELYHRRPEPARLTEFYLWTSFGGVIGGIRPPRADDVLLFRRADRRRDRSVPCVAGPVCSSRGGWARHRQSCLPSTRGRSVDVFRARSACGPHRTRSDAVPVLVDMRTGYARRVGRCTVDAGSVTGSLRSRRARRVLL